MTAAASLDVSRFLDDRPIGWRQWVVFGLCMMVLAIDGFDNTAIGFIAPALIDDWGIEKHHLGPVMMSGLLGTGVGCAVAGPLADRFGRRVVIIGSVFLIGVWSVVSAFSVDVLTLGVFRFLTGLGLGASMPNAATLVSEFAPKRRRSLMVTSIYAGFPVGAALGGFGSDWLINHFGWDSVLLVGGIIPLAFTVLLLLLLPESIVFMAQRQERLKVRIIKAVNGMCPGLAHAHTRFYSTEEVVAGRSSVSALFARQYAIGTVAIWVLLFVGLINMYLLSSWLPLLARSAGLSLSEAAVIGAVLQVGGVIGNFAIGWMMDRWESHRIIAATLLGGALTAVVIAQSSATMAALLPLTLVLGYFVNSANAGTYALSAQFYPVQFRATGVSWATGIGRLGSICGAGAGASMLALGWGFKELFMFLSCPALIGMVAVLLKLNSQRNAAAVQAS